MKLWPLWQDDDEAAKPCQYFPDMDRHPLAQRGNQPACLVDHSHQPDQMHVTSIESQPPYFFRRQVQQPPCRRKKHRYFPNSQDPSWAKNVGNEKSRDRRRLGYAFWVPALRFMVHADGNWLVITPSFKKSFDYAMKLIFWLKALSNLGILSRESRKNYSIL